MSSSEYLRHRSMRLKPLVACLATLLAGGEASGHAPAPSNQIVVQNCLDSGSGSLRAAVQSSGDGDTIDLTQLTCSLITLTSSRIDTTHNLLLRGPGSGLLTIDGNNNDRIFNQNQAGAQIAIYGMTLQRGYGFLKGGCVYSKGPVLLNDAVITGCRVYGLAGTSIYEGGGVFADALVFAADSKIVDNRVYTTLGGAVGGGLSASGDVVLINSTISGNRADSAASSGIAVGGGADIGGELTMQYSTIADNEVSGLVAGSGIAGGVRAIGPVVMQNSTVSGNTAGASGGLLFYGQGTTTPSLIQNSTISGNTALSSIGGFYAHGTLTIANSTIAFNTEANSLGAGMRIAYGIAAVQSSIIASNTGTAGTINIGEGIGGGISGANDLIGPSGTTTLPPGTIQSDPRLLPLANNGGVTKTHELRSDSPAIDAGNNTAGLTNDQRGPGFARVLGANADIGAVELDSDVIFGDGFD